MNAELDIKLSNELRKKFRTKPRECFYNASTKIFDLHDPNAFYIEGVCIVCDTITIPMEHAWILSMGKIIELTITNLNNIEVYYYPILSYSLQDISKNMRKGWTTPPFYQWNKDLSDQFIRGTVESKFFAS